MPRVLSNPRHHTYWKSYYVMAHISQIAIDIGLPCFPCRADKRPATPHGLKDATSEPDGIRELWRRSPGPLIGVPTGDVSGFDVLDVHSRNCGGAWYTAHKEKLPTTRFHRTRSGGLHVLLKHQDGLRNSASKIAPGIDA